MKKGLLAILFLLSSNTSAFALSVSHEFIVRLGVFDASRTEFSYT